MRSLRRLAEPQIPRTDFELMTFVGTDPSEVSIEMGTWMAIE
jgi:hypothetical protein